MSFEKTVSDLYVKRRMSTVIIGIKVFDQLKEQRQTFDGAQTQVRSTSQITRPNLLYSSCNLTARNTEHSELQIEIPSWGDVISTSNSRP